MEKKILRVIALIMILASFCTVLFGCGSSEGNTSGGLKEVLQTEPEVPETTVAPTMEPEPTPEPTEAMMTTTELAAYVQERTVTISVTLKDGSSTGSGFFIDDAGTIVTSYHVIDGAEAIQVEISGGGKYDVSRVVDVSELYDIAVIRIDISGNPYLDICHDGVLTGEKVYAVGSSLGFLDGTFSDGVVSSASRNVGVISCVQTTAAISSGNSGGPLVNEKGQVVGINAFSYTSGENLNLAVKMSMLDLMSQDKNWTINQYREWYKKEIERSYQVYNYVTNEFELSKINTFQYVTGIECALSSLDWNFLDGDYENVYEGYVENTGVFIYEYDVKAFDEYTEYLGTIGYEFVESKDYTDGVSYFYENAFTGYCLDIFILAGDEIMVIEPYFE